MSSSAPTRRNGHNTTTPSSKPPPLNQSQATPSPTTSPLTPLLPTPTELALLATYPLVLLLGSLYSTLSPQTRSSPYNPTTQSHPPATAPSYFALKTNLPNIYFVKIAWFWVSLSYLLYLFTHPSHAPNWTTLTPKKLQGGLRWGIVTMWWAGVTQWFFGPGLIDRGFRVTGGACELAERFEGEGGGMEFVTGQACKAVGGMWRGGHDISGHVFILVLGSAFLGLEVLPVLVRGREERRVRGGDGRVGRVERVDVDGGEGREGGRWGLGAVLGVMGMSWWMLLMTATFFHTWFEKLTGLLVAIAGIFVVYFLPRALPGMRDIVGLPGV